MHAIHRVCHDMLAANKLQLFTPLQITVILLLSWKWIAVKLCQIRIIVSLDEHKINKYGDSAVEAGYTVQPIHSALTSSTSLVGVEFIRFRELSLLQ